MTAYQKGLDIDPNSMECQQGFSNVSLYGRALMANDVCIRLFKRFRNLPILTRSMRIK